MKNLETKIIESVEANFEFKTVKEAEKMEEIIKHIAKLIEEEIS